MSFSIGGIIHLQRPAILKGRPCRGKADRYPTSSLDKLFSNTLLLTLSWRERGRLEDPWTAIYTMEISLSEQSWLYFDLKMLFYSLLHVN